MYKSSIIISSHEDDHDLLSKVFANSILTCIIHVQEASQRRTHVSLADTAVTPALSADREKGISSPASVLLDSPVTAAHVTV